MPRKKTADDMMPTTAQVDAKMKSYGCNESQARQVLRHEQLGDVVREFNALQIRMSDLFQIDFKEADDLRTLAVKASVGVQNYMQRWQEVIARINRKRDASNGPGM